MAKLAVLCTSVLAINLALLSSPSPNCFSTADTKIGSNSDDPEDMIIEADQDILMSPDASLVVDAGAGITLDSATGLFPLKYGGTEFIPSIYAGLILGYTRISNDSTTSGHAHIEPDATMTVLQTAQGTDVSVTFVAPPSGNVEISMLCSIYASSKTLEFALSDNASFSEIGETHTYDGGAQSSDETDINMTYVSFINTGLTAGTEYTRWIGAAETASGTSNLRHGRNRTSGTHYPPIIVKAIALPATITTGE